MELAIAHEAPAHRHGLVSFRVLPAGKLAIDVMITLQPSGKRARHLIHQFDLNKDLKLSTMEAQFAANALREEALGGFHLLCGGQELTARSTKAKAHIDGQKRLMVAHMYSFELDDCSPSSLAMAVSKNRQRRGLENISIRLGRAPGLKFLPEQTNQFVLKPGERRSVAVSIRPKNPRPQVTNPN